MLKKKPPKFDTTIWSVKRISEMMKGADKEAKGMTRKDLEGYYSSNLANIHLTVNARNRWMKRHAALQKRLRKQSKVLKLTMNDVARRHGMLLSARKTGWNDALEAVAKDFERAGWDMVTGEAGAAKIREYVVK